MRIMQKIEYINKILTTIFGVWTGGVVTDMVLFLTCTKPNI